MRYFLHAMRVNLKRAAQYRLSFFLSVVSQLIMTGGDMLAVLVLLDRFEHLGQWKGPEILFFFGMIQIVFSIAQTIGRGIEEFSGTVREGNFDRLLLRPRGLLVQVMFSELDPRRLGNTLVGIFAICTGAQLLGFVWTPLKVLLLAGSVVSTTCLMLGLFTVGAVISFFAIDSIEMVNILTYGGKQVAQYPLDIYPEWIRVLFTGVPLALCLYVPVSSLLGKMYAPPAMLVLALLSGPLFWGLVMLIWAYGVRHYRSTGS